MSRFVYLLILHFLYQQRIVQQFAVLIYQIQAPEESVPAPTAPVVSTPIEGETAAASATTLPPPTTQPNPPVASPSFWAFFWHHIRTDPRARLCELYFYYLQVPTWNLQLDRHDIIPHYNTPRSNHFVAHPLSLVRLGVLFGNMDAPNRQIGQKRTK